MALLKDTKMPAKKVKPVKNIAFWVAAGAIIILL